MIKKIRLIYILAFAFIFIFTLENQAQGLNPHFGTSSAVMEGGTGQAQTGFVIGADARLNEGKMYFVVGLQYHKISEIPQSEFRLFPDNTYNILKFRVGLGYDLIQLGDLFTIRGKTLASIDMISGVSDNLRPYNDGVAGVILGLGFDLLVFTFDVELEKGLFNAINKVPDTKIDFVNFTVGMIF